MQKLINLNPSFWYSGRKNHLFIRNNESKSPTGRIVSQNTCFECDYKSYTY